MSNKDLFIPVTDSGWKMGFITLLKKELKTWFGTSAWWQQALLWTLVLVVFGSVGIGDPEVGVIIFFMMAMIFPSIAVIIISQERILEEKRSGSAAWVLSKPVSRTAFILAKLIPVAVGFSFSMIFFPGVMFYLVSFVMGTSVPASVFLLSLVPMMLWQIFLSWLTICLGTFFDKEGPVMAVPFPFLFIGPSLAQNPVWGPIGPWGLLQFSLDLINGETTTILPVVITIAALIILAIVAVARFRKHEF